MIALCTGEPTAARKDGFVVISVPSGAGPIEIALTPHQAFRLHRAAREVAHEAIEDTRHSASIVPFAEAGRA